MKLDVTDSKNVEEVVKVPKSEITVENAAVESPWDGWRTGDGEISDLRTSSNVFPNPQSDLPGLPL